MTEEEKELQDQETWDFSQTVVSPGMSKARAVVSVAFVREDYQQVVQAAKKSGVKTSEFIRSAALSKAQALTIVTSMGFAGVSLAGMITEGPSVSGTSTATKPTEDMKVFAVSG